MKQLTWKLVIPLTIISFVVFSKWWYVDIVDGPDEILTGFPVPYMCPGWHTSLSLQIFVSALIIDLLTYFAFWLMLTLVINRFVVRIRLSKLLTIFFLWISGFLSACMILIAGNPDNIYTFHKDFEMEILETGYKFIWENQTQPDYYKYHPELKKE